MEEVLSSCLSLRMALLEEQMAQYCMKLSPLYLFAVQEASQWDLRSFPLYFLVVSLVFLFLLLVPVVQLLRRTGHSPVWCILSVLPVLNLGALWLFAFKPWPTDKTSAAAGN